MSYKITKTEIRQSLLNAIQETISKYGVLELPKKKNKVIESFSKKLAVDIKDEIKKKVAGEIKAKKIVIKKSRKAVATSIAD
jgi:hypothetical protein